MKKSLYVTIALVLCLLLFCAACGKDKQPSSDDIAPPDGTQDITPDNSQINDTHTPNDTNKPNDPVISDTPAPPARDNNKDNSPDNNDPADNTKPDDTRPPEDPKYVPVYRHPDNEKALQAYYDFLKNNGKARLAGDTRELTLSETFEIMYAKAHDEFAFYDFGSDGVQELAIKTYHEYLVLFWENGRLYIDNVGIREMHAGYNGIDSNSYNISFTESSTGYTLKSFSAENGMESLSLGYSIYHIYEDTRSCYILRDLVNGEWVDRENTSVTEEAFRELMSAYENTPKIKWYPMTMTYDYSSFCDMSRITVPADMHWLPFPGEPVKPYTSIVPTFATFGDLNTTALQNYYAFLTGEAVAYDMFNKKMISNTDLTNNGEAPLTSFSLVDYGGDGVLEVWLYRKNTDWLHEYIKNSVAVLFFDNGNLYVDYLSRVGVSTQTYDGKIVRYDYAGSYIYEVVTVSAENGVHRQAIARLESGLYNDKYYISATYENGIYTDAPERECTKDEFDAFVKSIDHGFSRQTMNYTRGRIEEVFLSLK